MVWKASNVLLVTALLAAASMQAGSAHEAASAEEVIDKVRQAASLIESYGDAALDMIAARPEEFRWKDTYIFVVDCNADRVMVNLAFPDRVGGDIKQHTDYAGHQYGRELCAKAAVGGGWIEYVWLRPGEDTPMRKISFVISVDDNRYQVGAGIYDDTMSLAELEEFVE